MQDFIEELKEKVRIEDLIEEQGIDIGRRGGRYLRARGAKGTGVNSLVVDTHLNCYFWNGQSEQGDIFTWLMARNPSWDFRRALEYCAEKAHVTLPPASEGDMEKRVSFRAQEDTLQVASRVFARWLKADKDAWAYATGRGWSEETIEKAQLGFSGRSSAADIEDMRGEFAMHGIDPESVAGVAVLGFRGDVKRWKGTHKDEINLEYWNTQWEEWGSIPGMMGYKRLVYPHFERGRIRNMTGRNILGDEVTKEGREIKSYNLPVALMGSRMLFYNQSYGPRAEAVVIVEGQADAITLAQWEIPALAWAGTGWKDHEELLTALRERHEVIYLAMDDDSAGRKTLRGADEDYPLIDVLGPLCRYVVWPEKDANDWLQAMIAQGIEPERQVELTRKTLEVAEPLVVLLATATGAKRGAKKDALLKRALGVIASMNPIGQATYRKQLSDALDVGGLREYNHLVNEATKALKKENTGSGPESILETLGGWFPVQDEEANGQNGENGKKNGRNKKRGWLVEYVYDTDDDSAQLAYRDPDGEIGIERHLDINGVRYVPVRGDDIIRGGGVTFPDKLGELKSTRELVAMVELFIKRYFLLDSALQYKLASYYVLLTWLFDCFSALPYLRAQGDHNTGKSELMLRIGHLCYRLVISTGASSTASLKFALDAYRGTIFMDEMDIADKFDERIVIMNVGAMRDQAKVWNMTESIRADGTRGYRAQMANVYGPKLVTMYGKFTDPATESRCLTFKLNEKEAMELIRANIPTEKTEKFYRQATHMRNLLLRWRLEHWEYRVELNQSLVDPMVNTRINQVTMPLKWIAMKAEDEALMQEVVGFIRSLNDEMILDRSLGLNARVMDAVIAILEEERFAEYVIEGNLDGFGMAKYVLYKHLAKVANTILDEMNISEDEDEEGDTYKRKGKAITSHRIGKIAREDLRLPVKRTKNGFVVILDAERIEMLKIKFGLDKPIPSGEAEPTEPSQGALF